MKTTIIAAILAVATTAAQAQQTTNEICTGWGELAATVMEVRQSGAPLSSVLAVFPDVKPIQYAMIMDAYDTPRYRTPRIVAEVIEDFRNDQEYQCFDVFSEGA